MKRHSYIGLIASAILIASCTGNKENPQARVILDEARDAFAVANYNRALTLLDSLQHGWPEELSLQREGMGLRPQIIEMQAMQQADSVRALVAADSTAVLSLKPGLKWIKDERMIEGYFADAATYSPTFLNTTGIQPRVSEIGQFYIVTSVNPSGSLKHTSISVANGSESAATEAVPYDGDSNYRISGSEMLTFSPEQSDTIGAFVTNKLQENPSATFTLTFHGNGTKQMKLTNAQAAAIALTWTYSQAMQRGRQNTYEIERLNRVAQIARRQQGKE